MDKMFLPVILEENFEAFRRLKILYFPDTYAFWLQSHRQRLSEYGCNYDIVEIPINPDQFTWFIQEYGKAANTGSLVDCAIYFGELKK